jgi:hypothetical protein
VTGTLGILDLAAQRGLAKFKHGGFTVPARCRSAFCCSAQTWPR